MRASWILLAIVGLAGCAATDPTAVPLDAPGEPSLPAAREAEWTKGIRVALPPGPSTVALLLDILPEAWQPIRLTPAPTVPYEGGWYLPLAVAVQGLDAWDETGDPPRVGVMTYRVVDGVVSLGQRWNPNDPLEDDTPVTRQDYLPCQPPAMRYLVVFLLDGRLPPNATVNATVFAGDLVDEPPSEPVVVSPDLVGSGAYMATYWQTANEKRARGWEVEDGRTGASSPVQPFGASVGTVSARLEAGLAPPGLYGYWLTRVAIGTEGGVWSVVVGADGTGVSSTTYPLTGAVTSLTWIHGIGSAASTWDLAVELTSATPEPALYELVAMGAPLDLASLGLRVEPAETMARWHDVYPALVADPLLCPP